MMERHVAELQHAIREINEAWISGQVERLEAWFDPEMVIVAPESQARVVGRGPCIDSYREFVTQAVVHRFEPSNPVIDLFDDTAIAICPFVIDYEIGGQRSVERGRDLLVFRRRESRWWVVWRTLVVDQAEAEPRNLMETGTAE